METKSLKALAKKVLQRNQQGNLMETKSFPDNKLEGQKVSTMETQRKIFEDLFHSHAEKLKRHFLTSVEIKRQRIDLWTEIQSAVKDMDTAWFKEDLQGFKKSMDKIESLYFKALEEITDW